MGQFTDGIKKKKNASPTLLKEKIREWAPKKEFPMSFM